MKNAILTFKELMSPILLIFMIKMITVNKIIIFVPMIHKQIALQGHWIHLITKY